MWFIGVEVEQETSVPPPKKNPGSPLLQFDMGDIIDDITEKPTSGHFELVYFHSFGLFKLGN